MTTTPTRPIYYLPAREVARQSGWLLCPYCTEPIEAYIDEDGTWVSCACDAGYSDRVAILDERD